MRLGQDPPSHLKDVCSKTLTFDEGKSHVWRMSLAKRYFFPHAAPNAQWPATVRLGQDPPSHLKDVCSETLTFDASVSTIQATAVYIYI